MAKSKSADSFTDDERAAMKARRQELKAGKADGEGAALAAIAAMQPADRALGERIHALVKQAAPQLSAKTWYGMPAYALNDQTVCFFQSGQKFKTRYATLGFTHHARLDDGEMWPTAFAIDKLTPAAEARITALVRQAVG